jgi:hypothetical protein
MHDRERTEPDAFRSPIVRPSVPLPRMTPAFTTRRSDTAAGRGADLHLEPGRCRRCIPARAGSAMRAPIMSNLRLSRRSLLRAAMPAAGAVILTVAPGLPARAATVELWRSPTCSCCHGWIEHLEQAGFAIRAHEVDDLEPIRRSAGIADDLASCHTAAVAGYVLEGHVPAAAIRKLLAERPVIRGLAVPGMPPGAPGMAEPGAPVEPFEVMALAKGGGRSTFMVFGG